MYASTEQGSRERVQSLADRLYRDHHGRLLAIARRNAANEADAAEALHDAFILFIEHFDPSCEAPPLAWLTLKRRCWALYRAQHLDRRAGQEAAVGSTEQGFSITAIPAKTAGVEESIERASSVLEAREQLAYLKPAERLALGLFAAGCSYAEIGQMNDWTFTKVDRCLKEGRAALREMATG
ncbi:MAG TPA: sigma factor [Solirubrobacterales bacterium]